jgi:NAD(P)-dependent dehydrogenase (short-subunit alcohol dehydrogenase family)
MKRLDELSRMNGRVAVVTGGAGHLGLSIGEALVESGAHVFVVDRDEASCAERAALLTRHGGVDCAHLAVDLSAADGPSKVIDAVLARFGRIDVLVNNAAYTGDTKIPGYAVPFDQQRVEAWDAAMRVNLTVPFQLSQAASVELGRRGAGTIVNVGSIYGIVGPDMGLYRGTSMGNPAAYGASKGGLIQLTRYLSTVLAPSVRVNCISPGGIARGQAAEFRERYVARTPLGRMGAEEDMKGAIAFLASDLSAYVTGQSLAVDGGWTAW